MASHRLIVRKVDILSLTLLLASLCAAQAVPGSQRPKTLAASGQTVAGSPVSVSPGNWSQLAEVGPGHFTELFGTTAAVSGDTVVVGSWPTFSDLRTAYIFLKSDNAWQTRPAASLRVPSPNGFPSSLAIDGNTVVIGFPSSGAGFPSYAYVYVKPVSGWENMAPTAVLTPSDSLDGSFGRSVSVSGDTIIVGDPAENSSTGAGYVYVKPIGGWQDMTETAKLTASDGALGDQLGASASVSSTTIALGAPQLANFASGKAYVYVRPTAGWTDMTQTAELTLTQDQPETGWSIATNGTFVVVGAPYLLGDGTAYLFERPSSGWADMTETATLSPADQQQSAEQFGLSVGISGKMVAVTAPRRGASPNLEQGGVYIFEEPAGGWQNMSSQTVLTGSDAHYLTLLGECMGMSGKVVVSGAQPAQFAGTAYIFALP